jgi:DNA-binding response OmpR family regulator
MFWPWWQWRYMKLAANPKYNILVVDDDISLNTTFTLLLGFDGHEVRTAFSGEAALALLSKSKFDLIITEYWLPRMRGDELAILIKEKWPHQPIIVATANIEELNKDAPPIAGVDCLLNKPFSISQLREAMIWAFARYAESRSGNARDQGMRSGHIRELNKQRCPSRRRSGL